MSSPPITPEQLAALPPEIRAVVQAIIDHYERQVAELKAQVAQLQAELAAAKKTPRNSSLPPSSEHPHAKPPPAKPKSKRRRGGVSRQVDSGHASAGWTSRGDGVNNR